MIQSADLHTNFFTSTIPSSFCQWNITDFIGSDNFFTGPLLPNDCRDQHDGQFYMKNFYLDQNHMNGTLPEVICSWNSIYFFDIASNQLNGTMPACIMKWMYFGETFLHGTVPDAICAWTTVAYLDLSFSYFTGSLPDCLGHNIVNAYAFYMVGNDFSGTLPVSFGEMKTLQYVQMRNNQFLGSLPKGHEGVERSSGLLFPSKPVYG